jgi:hypothetical protein
VLGRNGRKETLSCVVETVLEGQLRRRAEWMAEK